MVEYVNCKWLTLGGWGCLCDMAQTWPWGSQIAVKKISRQPSFRTDQERERKENTKTQGMKEINKKICYACESDNHEIKDCDSGKNIFIIDRASKQINKEELKYRLE